MLNIIYGLIDPTTKQLRYVGQSCKGVRRARAHIYNGTHGTNEHKRNWVNKLLDAGLMYEVEVLETVTTRVELDEAEMFYIAYFRSIGCDLLNATAGGSGIWNPTAETRAKTSAWQKGVPKPEEYREKISKGLVGNHNRVGKEMSPEKLEKYVLDRNSPFIDQYKNVYQSIKECSEKTGIDKSHISSILNGRRRSANGYFFIYIDKNLRSTRK